MPGEQHLSVGALARSTRPDFAILGPFAWNARGPFPFPEGMVSANSGGSFATLTHARLRAAQGDVDGAVRILRVILDVQPGHDEARALLAEIEDRVGVVHKEPTEDLAEAVMPATAQGLTRRFRDALGGSGRSARIERLFLWLERTQRNRGARHVR